MMWLWKCLLFPFSRKSVRSNVLSVIVGYVFLLILFFMVNSMSKWTRRSKKALTADANLIHRHIREDHEETKCIEELCDWQTVTGSNYNLSVYSAYSFLNLDNHHSSKDVLIIGITKELNKDDIKCQFYFNNNNNNGTSNGSGSNKLSDVMAVLAMDSEVIPGSIDPLTSESEEFYSGVFLRCPLPSRKDMKPEAVSVSVLSDDKTVGTLNMIRIRYLDEFKESPYRYEFSVCVPPTFNFTDGLHFLEWLEYYKLMGVEQFTFYNASIGPDVSCLMEALMNGIDPTIKVNVHSWDNNYPRKNVLKMGPGDTIIAGLNDCLYRHRGKISKYVAFVDLDEFIFPRADSITSFKNMINLVDSQHPQKLLGEYQFRTGFFLPFRSEDKMLWMKCSPFSSSPLKHRICLQSLLMKNSMREDYHPHGANSTYIIKPEGVKQIAHRVVDIFEEGYESAEVPSTIGFSRHYHFHDAKKGSYKNPRRDRIYVELGARIVENVAKRIEDFGNNTICKNTLNNFLKNVE